MVLVNYVVYEIILKVINLGLGYGGDGEMIGLRKKVKEGMESIIRMYYKYI